MHYDVCYSDMQRNELIPLMDIFYGTAVELIKINNKKGKILDLGAGTGLLTKLVIKKYPNTKYTLVDIADEMLASSFSNQLNVIYPL